MGNFIKKKLSNLLYLNTTQFLGALNDNLYKLFLIYLLIDKQGAAYSDRILSTVGAVFVIPFILFSALAGTLADRYSKRTITLITKYIELFSVILGIISFWLENAFLGYSALFLLAAQSALFGPSKYGIIPEIVEKEQISKANGLLSSFTYLAIIFGTFLGSFFTDISDHHIFAASFSCLAIAIIGIFAAVNIPKTPAAGSKQKITINFLGELLTTLKRTSKEGKMLLVIFSGSFFLFLGAYTQLNIIPYALNEMKLSDVAGGYLFLIVALGIGSGSLVAGKLSGKRVELGLVPVGIMGMTLSFMMLGFFSHSPAVVFIFLFALGAFGGFYLVPLDSYIQSTSDPKVRGQNVALNNFLSFIGVLIASFFLFFFGSVLKLTSAQGFLAMSALSFIVMIFIVKAFFVQSLGLVAQKVVKKFCSIEIHGRELLLQGKGAILVCPHPRGLKFFLPYLIDPDRVLLAYPLPPESFWLKKLVYLQKAQVLLERNQQERKAHFLKAVAEAYQEKKILCIMGQESRVKRSLKGESYPLFLLSVGFHAEKTPKILLNISEEK
ncbi:MAG: MFS transporter [Parachlamydiales bacterium]|nr:MFS transporter [Parachlamydiales bacterium]